MSKKKAVKSVRRTVKGAGRASVKGKALAEDGDEVTLAGDVDGALEYRGRGGMVEVLPCPIPTDPAMGDKTPEVMAWYREHRPEEFERRYGNRVCPEVDEVVGGGVMENDDAAEGGPVSDFEEEDDERVVVKPRVIMG
jgi:hypothetical protein